MTYFRKPYWVDHHLTIACPLFCSCFGSFDFSEFPIFTYHLFDFTMLKYNALIN